MRRRGSDNKPDALLAKRLAKDLDVSISTISRAFSSQASIAPSTRERVLKRAREIGYRPNPFARTLITRKNDIIAIVVSNLNNPFYPAVLSRMTSQLQHAGFNAMLFACPDTESLDETVGDALHYQPDVLIALAVTVSSQAAGRAAKAGTRVIFFNRYVPDAAAFSVTCDNVTGGAVVADFFLDRGHRYLVYIGGDPHATTNLDRQAGFSKRCLERSGQRPRIIEAGRFSHDAGFEAAQALFRATEPLDAIFCASDVIALGVLDAAREAGVNIPEQVSVVGFDDIEPAGWASYELTTYRQPVIQMIDATIELIRRISADPSVPTGNVVKPGEIIERRTVAARGLPTEVPL